uniref:Uncharacterized protein n=1 Tax=Syphacia muris TaxID=451379 RepID=A0A0N5A828_9BILA
MWAKADKGHDPLFIGSSTVRSHLGINEHFKHPMSMNRFYAASANSTVYQRPGYVAWNGNTARRRRFENYSLKIGDARLTAVEDAKFCKGL